MSALRFPYLYANRSKRYSCIPYVIHVTIPPCLCEVKKNKKLCGNIFVFVIELRTKIPLHTNAVFVTWWFSQEFPMRLGRLWIISRKIFKP